MKVSLQFLYESMKSCIRAISDWVWSVEVCQVGEKKEVCRAGRRDE